MTAKWNNIAHAGVERGMRNAMLPNTPPPNDAFELLLRSQSPSLEHPWATSRPWPMAHGLSLLQQSYRGMIGAWRQC